MTTDDADSPRHLQVWHFLVLAVIYIAIVLGVSTLLNRGQDADYAAPTSIDYIVRSLVVPVGLAIIFTLAVVGWLGAWQQIFVSARPLQRWVVAIPIILFLTVAVITNYPGLASKGLTFALLLLIGTLMVGFGEELIFRGVGVLAFRSNGFSEFRVGLWTTLIFGVAHGSNIITTGPQALIQVVLTSATGLVFYIILRQTGALVMAMAAHGLWDFSVLSSRVDPGQSWPLVNGAGVALALILALLLFLRKRVSVPESTGDEPHAHTPTNAGSQH